MVVDLGLGHLYKNFHHPGMPGNACRKGLKFPKIVKEILRLTLDWFHCLSCDEHVGHVIDFIGRASGDASHQFQGYVHLSANKISTFPSKEVREMDQ